jgi:post-segregation antitoxin (ccd killing protein)
VHVVKNLKPTKTGRPRVSKGVRLDPELVEQAEQLQINLAALLEAALKTEIRRRTSGRGFAHHSR